VREREDKKMTFTNTTKKYFIYMVEGTEFYGDEPWGEAWKNAEAFAKENHLPIWRVVVKENAMGEVLEENTEFYAKGCFLAERFYSPERVYLFND
jgi:hypothetical protein